MESDGGGDRGGEDTGWFDLEEDRERWLMMGVFAGRVLICAVECGGKRLPVPLFVKFDQVLRDGSIAAEVVSLGTTDSKESRQLTSLNKTLKQVHICNEVECRSSGNYLCHAKALSVIPGQELKKGYLGPSGYKRWVSLCQEVLGIEVGGVAGEEEPEEPAERSVLRPSALRRTRDARGDRGDRHPIFVGDEEVGIDLSGREIERGAEEKEVTEERSEKRDRGRRKVTEALSDLKSKLRESLSSPGEGAPVGAGLTEKKTPAASSPAVPKKPKTGPQNLSLGMETTSTAVKEKLKEALEEQREDSSSGKKPSSPMEAANRASGSGGQVGGKRRKRKRSEERRLKALRNVLKPKKDKDKKKRRKRRRR